MEELNWEKGRGSDKVCQKRKFEIECFKYGEKRIILLPTVPYKESGTKLCK